MLVKGNSAIATLRRLSKEEEEKNIEVFWLKLRRKKKQFKPKKIENGVMVSFRVPESWKFSLQKKADKYAKGNLSDYLRCIIYEDMKRKTEDSSRIKEVKVNE